MSEDTTAERADREARCARCTGEWAVPVQGVLACAYDSLCLNRGAPLPQCADLERCPMQEAESR